MAKILIVDDDKNLLLLYRRELEAEGYEVISAVDGKSAVERFRAERPDAVVLDVRMPEANGLDTMNEILAVDRDAPVILHSSYSCYKDDFVCWLADAYVAKSSDSGALKEAIRKSLVSRHAIAATAGGASGLR
jgi:DNA-binding NtrC family response regulator